MRQSIWRRMVGSTQRWWRSLFGARPPIQVLRSRLRLRGEDVLQFGSDGTIRVSPPTVPAPLGPAVIANPAFDNPRTQRLARKAAAFLFDYYGLGVIPGQFWPIFARSHDPGAALDAFLRAVGCDPQRIRQRDSVELRKAEEVIELLVCSGDILNRLSPKIRAKLSLNLETGDYASIKELASVAAQLQTAMDYAKDWSDKPLMASFAALFYTVARMLADPGATSADDAATAVSIVAQFAEIQRQFDYRVERFSRLLAELQRVRPGGWAGMREEPFLMRNISEFEAIEEGMRSSADRSADELSDGLAHLETRIAALESLLAAAAGGDAGPKDPGGGSRGGKTKSAPPPDEIEIYLRFFGFTKKSPPKSKLELKVVWTRKVKKLHPDRNLDETEKVRAERQAEFIRCDEYFRKLCAIYRWK